MTFWFLPIPLELTQKEPLRASLSLPLPLPPALPDLARLHAPDQLQAWFMRHRPELPPEQRSPMIEAIWRYAKECLDEDHVVLRMNDGTYMLAELAGGYFYDHTHLSSPHVLMLKWIKFDIDPKEIPYISQYIESDKPVEITNESLAKLGQLSPSIHRRSYTIFKWISVIVLLFELVYFWPR